MKCIILWKTKLVQIVQEYFGYIFVAWHIWILCLCVYYTVFLQKKELFPPSSFKNTISIWSPIRCFYFYSQPDVHIFNVKRLLKNALIDPFNFPTWFFTKLLQISKRDQSKINLRTYVWMFICNTQNGKQPQPFFIVKLYFVVNLIQ